MSLEAVFSSSGSAGTLANEAGWQALCEWVDEQPLESCQALDHLATYGYTDDLEDLERECEALLKLEAHPPGVQQILSVLLEYLKSREEGDDGLDVSSGCE